MAKETGKATEEDDMAKKSQQQSKRKKAKDVKDLSAGPKATNVKGKADIVVGAAGGTGHVKVGW